MQKMSAQSANWTKLGWQTVLNICGDSSKRRNGIFEHRSGNTATSCSTSSPLTAIIRIPPVNDFATKRFPPLTT